MKCEIARSLIGKDLPVLCKDSMLGMLLLYREDDGMCGIQVHGEDEHRWIHISELAVNAGGAIRQTGAPGGPKVTMMTEGVQLLLSGDWIFLGGGEMKTQWLFLGGPRHGTTFWVPNFANGVRENSTDEIAYAPDTHLFNGETYQLGRWPNGEVLSVDAIEEMIRNTCLCPIGDGK